MFERKHYLIADKFKQYLLPTILMSLSNSMAIVIDGMIVGNLLGAKELAAVNLAMPLSLTFSTIFSLIGVGGSTLMSIARGARDIGKARQVFSISFMFLFLSSVIFPLIGLFFMTQSTSIMSSQANLNSLVSDYTRVLFFGAPFIMIVSGLTYFIRSDGFPKYASKILIVSNVVNLSMDIILVRFFGFGIAGAAYATVIGYFVGALMILYFMLKIKHQLKFGKISKNFISETFSIITTGITSAFGQIFIFTKIICINHIVLNTLGTAGMIAFSVCLSCLSLVSLFIAGATQTMMPIVGVMFGEKDWQGIKFAVMPALKFVLYSAIVLIAGFLILPKQILALYGVHEQEYLKTGIEALRYFSPSLFGVGFSFVMMYYNQAINRKALAIAISIVQGLSVIPLAYFLSQLFGGKGIWLSFSITEVITALMIFSVSIYIRNKYKNQYDTVFLFNKRYNHKELDLTIKCNPESAVGLSQKISEFALQEGINQKTSMLVGLASEEMAMYIINNCASNKHIDVMVKINSNEVILRFRDEGLPLNPTLCNDDIENCPNIFLLKKIASNIDYVRIIGLNSTIITLKTMES
jgi:putative MATE family efflux protein